MSELDVFRLDIDDEGQADLSVANSSFGRYFAKDTLEYFAKWAYEKEVYSHAIEMPPDVIEMAKEARDFVAELTGFEVNPPVYYFDTIDNERTGYLNAVVGYVALRKVELGEAQNDIVTDYYRHMNLTSTLVHEFMHAVDMQRRRVAYVDVRRKDKWPTEAMAVTIGNKKFDARSNSLGGGLTVVGDFYTEGFAEWGASCYREKIDPVRQTKRLATEYYLIDQNGPPVHSRYINSTNSFTESVVMGSRANSAYAAEAIRKLSVHTGVDLFQLKIDMLNPEISIAAERKFIQTIDSVEKGLYSFLRDSPYTAEGFADAYTVTIDAMEKHRQRLIASILAGYA